MQRTHTCGQLNENFHDQTVYLCGWVDSQRNHGGLIFVDLRDRYGITQIVFDPDANIEAYQKALELKIETTIGVKGLVRMRPENMQNVKMPTGKIEIAASELTIFCIAKPLPFPLSNIHSVTEALRLKYRYLELRNPELQKNFVIRHRMVSWMRSYLDQKGFFEVETPYLYKSTPEGARDFIVPSRVWKGSFYALPQSPQILKQLLMIAGTDRYYQVARCFRDEDLRADRQPEFTQLDLEVSFMSESTLLDLIEPMIIGLWKEILGIELQSPFLRMTYSQAIQKYGSDKPDLRFDLQIQDFKNVFEKSVFEVFRQASTIAGILIPGGANHFSRKDLDQCSEQVKIYGAKGVLWVKYSEGQEITSPGLKYFSEHEIDQLKDKMNPTDLLLIIADKSSAVVYKALGALRLHCAAKLGLLSNDLSQQKFVWITHFPLLEYDAIEKRFIACHHPFTAPQPECVEDLLLGKNLDELKACAYDLVLNGAEIAGGSVRIHDPQVQAAMFRAIGMNEKEAYDQFGFFLDALQYGTPPHAGMAFGLDRLAALMCNASSIRDVIAFPKTGKGQCLMSHCPSVVSQEQMLDLGITCMSLKS